MSDSDAVARAQSAPGPDEKRMRLRYAGVCRTCATDLPARVEAIYERGTRTVRCLPCAQGRTDRVVDLADVESSGVDGPAAVLPAPVPLSGVAGASARREHERRRARDEERTREKWGRWGGIAVALSGERSSTASWARGAVGEERVGSMLDQLAGPGLAVLHDRGIPGSRANIDHLVVTREAVFVIDPKRYTGRPALRVEGGVLRPRVEKLVVAGRDRTKLVRGVLGQVARVQDVVGDGVPVRGVLCFVDSDWPLLGSAFSTQGVTVLWPRRLRKVLSTSAASDGAIDPVQVATILAARLPSA